MREYVTGRQTGRLTRYTITPARRRRPNGEPWLTPDLIAAAFRFHESYEIARLSGEITRDWDSLMMGRVNVRAVAGSGGRAVRRVEAAEALAGAIPCLGAGPAGNGDPERLP
ncbi:MAG: DUF6456 domain-containing protein [Maritimibacter sp.]